MVPTDRWPLGSPGPASQASQILPDDAADRWFSWEEKKAFTITQLPLQMQVHAVGAGASSSTCKLAILGIHPVIAVARRDVSC